MFKKFGSSGPSNSSRPARSERAERPERSDSRPPQKGYFDRRPSRNDRDHSATSGAGGERRERDTAPRERNSTFESSPSRAPRGPRPFGDKPSAGPRARSDGPSAGPRTPSARPQNRRPAPGRDGKPYFKNPVRPARAPRDVMELKETSGADQGVRSVIQRTREVTPPAPESNMHFSEFNLPEEVERALADAGFERPTPIQEQSLPHTLGGFDLLGCAQTGTGKTAAFVIPMVTRLLEDDDSQALILAPTRELAAQIIETLRKLTVHAKHLRHVLIVGGAGYNEQVRGLRAKPRIVVATPGRLVDHLQQKTANLSKVVFFVLDEADRMFDMGFAPQINKIVAQIPAQRQTLLFSATFNKEVKTLALRSLKNPKEVFIDTNTRPAAGVEQEILETQTGKKFSILLDELNKREGTVLIFTGMKHRADKLSRTLEEYGHSVTRIHGGRTMGQRKAALKDFKDQRVRILVATDIAARGLDIPHVAHVINYDLPKDPEDYIHRIGRTARAGAIGKSLSFVVPEEKDNWKKISRLIGKN